MKSTPTAKQEPKLKKQKYSNKTSQKPTNSDNSNQMEESEVFYGKRFVNIKNDCYINSVVNLILSSEAVREGVNSKLCDCTLCEHLFNFLNNSNESHNARVLKTLLARLNPATFGEGNLNKQQDVEECLTTLIGNCANLGQLAKFGTFKKRKCMNEKCLFESNGSHEHNRTIFTCHINTDLNNTSITEDMINNRKSVDLMICSKCKLMTEEDGSKHDTEEVFSSLPSKIFIMSVKRFEYDRLSEQGLKIGNAVFPSSNILLKEDGQEQEYFLKSIIEHHGPHGMSILSGHYSCKVLLKNKWIHCNDMKINVTSTDPLGGYLFLYEKTPLNLSLQTLEHLIANINRANQQEDIIDQGFNQPNTSDSRKRKPEDTTSKEDCYSIDSVKVDHLSRTEILKTLDSMDLTYIKKQNTVHLRGFLQKKLQSKHKIHEFLRSLEVSELKHVAIKINMKYDRGHDAMRKKVANYFFETSSDSPLSSLKKVISGESIPENFSVPKKMKIDKSNPVITYLKMMGEREIKEIVKKLGQNRLRNIESMRTFIAQFFFDIDNKSPLKVLQKFLDGELPELDCTLKKETTKRKSENGSGPHVKKAKIGVEEIKQNQEKLKEKRKSRLEYIAKKEDTSSFYVDNPIIEEGLKFKDKMSDWKQEEACKVCEESWFDQENATKGPNIGVCKRCRYDKDKECPTFSRLNEMIPGEQPECLKILNNIEVGAIRLIIPYMNVFKNKAGGRGFNGHSISFFQDVSTFALKLPDKLPRPVEELQIILMRES